MQPFWRITLLDKLTLSPVQEQEEAEAQRGVPGEVRRFRSQRSASLLAYLAVHAGRFCSRDVLCDVLWPDISDPEVARNRLRVALSSLRRQLEPPEVPRGAVLDVSVTNAVRLRSESVWTDVGAFEAALKMGDFQTARELLAGELLPTFYDEWILHERERLNYLVQSLSPAPNLSQVAPQSSVKKKTTDTLPSTHHHLPLFLTRFFGRERERERLRTLLSEKQCRLITLTGAGGQGKTRLSVEAARDQTTRPVWFVPLADLWEGDRLGDAIQGALELPRSSMPVLSQVAAFLQGQAAPLLVLDNLEQIAPAAVPVVTALLQRVPDLTLLVTSRVRLEIPGEQELPVAPLPMPERTALNTKTNDLAGIARFASVALFVDRAQSVRPDFQITERNAPDILGICQLLEGIPLGLELAAARSASLTPSQMRQKLTEHWDALPALGKTEKAHRHRSLRTAIEWSAALLPLDQRRLFIQLSIFQGGATLEAIEAVCQSPTTLDTLTRLRASSLVLLAEQNGAFRYSLLEVLRHWASEQLSIKDNNVLAERHAAWFYRFAETRKGMLWNLSGVTALEEMEVEIANFRAALAYCQAENITLYTEFVLVLTGFWEHKSYAIEAQNWLECAHALLAVRQNAEGFQGKYTDVLLALGTNAGRQGNADAALIWLQKARDLNGSLPDALKASLCGATGRAYWVKGALPEALAQFEESSRRYEAAGDPVGLAAVLSNIGAVLRDSGDYEGARTAFTRAIQLSRQHELPRTLASALNNFAALRHILGEDGVQELYDESLALNRALRMPGGVAVILSNLALLYCRQKNWAEGRRLTEEATTLLRATGNQRNLAISVGRLGQIADAEGKHDEAKSHFMESLRLRLAGGNPHDITIALIAFSEHAFSVRKFTKAAQILGAVQTGLGALKNPLPVDEAAEFEQHCALVQASLTAKAFKKAFSEGASWSQNELIQKLQK